MSCSSRACLEKGEEQNHGDHFQGWEIWSLRTSWLRSLVHGARPSAWTAKLYNLRSKWDLSFSVSTDLEFYCPFLSFFCLLYLIKQNFCSTSRLLVSHLGWQDLTPFLAGLWHQLPLNHWCKLYQASLCFFLGSSKSLKEDFIHTQTYLAFNNFVKILYWMPTKSTRVTEHGLEAPTAEC